MSRMCTLHDISMQMNDRQPGMVDSLTEEAPIFGMMKFIPASHKLWNIAEKLVDVKGPGWAELDGPLPLMEASSDLETTHLHVMGGTLEVPTQRALKFGGAAKYFADRQDHFLKHMGMDIEKQIAGRVWLAGATAEGNVRNAGGKAGSHILLAVRFDDLANVGLYDPDQFDSSRIMKIDFPYGGDEHYLRGKDYEGVLGYSITYRANFGWQLLDAKRTCAAIINIDKDHAPTVDMIDEMLADIRATPGNTYLFCSPKARIYSVNKYKHELVRMVTSDTEAKTSVDVWNGIPVVASHNMTAVEEIAAKKK